MKTLLVTLALFTAVTAHAREFTLVTETTVDAANLFEGRDDRPVSSRDAVVPESIAHKYTLRTTYTLVGGEGDAKIQNVAAGCAGPWVLHCWNDHLSAELDVTGPGSNVRFQLLDRASGKVIGDKQVALENFPLKLSTQTMQDAVDFSGTSNTNVRLAEHDEEALPRFPLADGQHELSFIGIYEFAIFDGVKFKVARKGAANHYELAGIEYGGHTATGDQLDLAQGKAIPAGDVEITNLHDQRDAYSVAMPGARKPRILSRIVRVQ